MQRLLAYLYHNKRGYNHILIPFIVIPSGTLTITMNRVSPRLISFLQEPSNKFCYFLFTLFYFLVHAQYYFQQIIFHSPLSFPILAANSLKTSDTLGATETPIISTCLRSFIGIRYKTRIILPRIYALMNLCSCRPSSYFMAPLPGS